jgi:hypothetical protein
MDEKAASSTTGSSGLDLVWGAENIAKEINRTPRQTYHLLQTNAISAARRKGGLWCADRNALRREFGGTAEATAG